MTFDVSVWLLDDLWCFRVTVRWPLMFPCDCYKTVCDVLTLLTLRTAPGLLQHGFKDYADIALWYRWLVPLDHLDGLEWLQCDLLFFGLSDSSLCVSTVPGSTNENKHLYFCTGLPTPAIPFLTSTLSSGVPCGNSQDNFIILEE